MSKEDRKFWFYMVIGFMFGTLLIGIGLYGSFIHDDAVSKCTASTVATVYSEDVESYLYAPYHGGEVVTKYRTNVKYAFTVDSDTYTIGCTFLGQYNDYPESIDVIYNPDNPDEFFYNHNAISNPESAEVDWWHNDRM